MEKLHQNSQPEARREGILSDREINVGDTSCRFIGVRHTPEVFEINQAYFEKVIVSAEVLVAELAVFEEQPTSDIGAFYKEITDMAATYKTPLVIPDPEKNLIDALINRSVDLTGMITAVGSAGYLAYVLRQASSPDDFKARIRRRRDKQTFTTSRRAVLGGLLASAVAVPAVANVTASMAHEMGDRLENDLLDQYFLSSLDYRDVCIARTIVELAEKHSHITVIYGGGHTLGVNHYLEDTELLATKAAYYDQTFGLWSPASTEAYDWQNNS